VRNFQTAYIEAASRTLEGEDAAFYWKRAKDELKDSLTATAISIMLLLWWRTFRDKDMPEETILHGMEIDLRAHLAISHEAEFYARRATMAQDAPVGLLPYNRAKRILTLNGDLVGQEARRRALQVPAIGSKFPFMLYRSHHDDRVRNTHEEMDGTVYSRSWRHADTITPPAGHNCRCVGLCITLDDAKKLRRVPAESGIVWSSQRAKDNFYRGLFPDRGW
jgi:hypothetical protein